MKELSDSEIKQKNLELLKYITNFCEENHINYILSDGTLLGAVRHNGFIPWDIDIDISMLRSDYEQFLSVWNDNKDYAVISHEKNSNYLLPFAKFVDLHTVCYEHGIKSFKGGIWIDIFPLDAVPDEKKLAEKYFKKLCVAFDKYVVQKNISQNLHGFNYILHKIYYSFSLKYKDLFFFLKNTKKCLNEIVELAQKYNGSETKNVNNNVLIFRKGSPYRKFGYPKECTTDFIYHKFESLTCRIPKNYDALLKCYYNNYMTLPPKEKQVDTHGIVCYEVD